ncbi:MAG: hypothetical protein OJJ21_00860 [Ferrovibrio sp.]|uniref:hypothetical protein n=1 Tax=Ferrovibrio sp. TaxID=1917215 RepID=UPI002619B4E4|nr:hypothetical protein [Ferrovibrio sp.]MCW0232125.1 hypothetical protein [Ferrovibrio sp.]
MPDRAHLTALSITLLLASLQPAAASTPAAWQGLFAEAGRRCAAASGLLDAAALAQPADFGDEVLVLVGGMCGRSRI